MKRSLSIVLLVAMIQLVFASSSIACGSAPTLIWDAAREGNLAEVTRLIALDRANLEAHDRNGFTPLHWAARCGRLHIVQALIAFGVDVNATRRELNIDGYTALHDAASCDHLDIVQALISLGADVNATSSFGSTPLHFVAHTAIAQALIAHGASLEARERDGDTALQRVLRGSDALKFAALQPETIAQLHTKTAHAYTAAGNHAFAARSHTWAAQALPGTEAARLSYTSAAESFTAFGDHAAAGTSYDIAGNHLLAAESHTLYAHAHAATGDYATAVKHYQLAHASHMALGNDDLAKLSQGMVNCYAPIVDSQRHAAAMDTHFRTAEAKVDEIATHRASGDEEALALTQAQVEESLESAESSKAHAISALEAALTALDGALEGAMKAREEVSRVDDAAAKYLTQHAALVESLRAHIECVSRKIVETHTSAAAGRERVSAARGL